MTDCDYPANDQHFAMKESMENRPKRQRTDLADEAPELQLEEHQRKRRRTETGEKDVKSGKTEACVEASCSDPERESEQNPSKRKMTDLAPEEPELQPDEPQVKRRRTVKEGKDGKSKKMENCEKASPKKERKEESPNTDVLHDGREAEPREVEETSSVTDTEKKVRFCNRYILGKLLGKGGFGSVYAGIRKSDRKKVALKFIGKHPRSRFITLPGDTHRLPVEVALMELVCKPPHCPYVIQLLDWLDTPTVLFLVLERPESCVDLFDFCEHENVSESQTKFIVQQVIQAARHCRDRGVFHRDIKEENILLDPQTLEIKLIDFGCGALLKNSPYTKYAGTRNFQPPECILKHEYEAEPTTVWGLGVLMYRMLCVAEPFDRAEEIVNCHPNFSDHLSEASRSLMRWCLQRDPKRRPTLEQMLSHDWF